MARFAHDFKRAPITRGTTTRAVVVDYLANLGPIARCMVEIPAGTRVALIPGLDGLTGDGWVVSDIALLVKLTGNSHDPHYRYCVIPSDAVAAEGSVS